MQFGCSGFFDSASLNRRQMLRAGVAGIGGLSLASLLAAEDASPNRKSKAKQVIFLHQWGGPSHIDTFDMKPAAPADVRGEFSAVSSNVPGTPVCEHLPRMASVMNKFAQVRTVHHTVTNHNPAGYYMLSGHMPLTNTTVFFDRRDLMPGMGAMTSRFRPSDDPAVPSWVSLPWVIRDQSPTPGQTGSFMGRRYDALTIDRNPNRPKFSVPELALPENLSVERLDDRANLLSQMSQQQRSLEQLVGDELSDYRRRATEMLTSKRVQQAFDLTRESDRTRDEYGRTTYGQSCLLARRLIESGVRCVSVYHSTVIGGDGEKAGWDTHAENFKQLKDRLLPSTDRTVPALMNDLAERGLLDETLVIWMGEFGRAPRITSTAQFGPNGRDHWPRCYTALLAGGGINGGAIYGASDRLGAYPSNDPVRPDDIAATIYWALGINHEQEIHDAQDRPVPVSRGTPLTTLFA
jgi:hypothetical protein